MGKLVKVCLVLVSILVVLAIVFVAGIFYGLYKATSPPEEFKVLGMEIVDDGGYPSLLVKFKTSKYTFLTFKLFDEMGRLVDMRMPTEGETAVALSLVGLKPYTNVVGARNYTLKVFYGEDVIYEKKIEVRGVKPVVQLVDIGVEKSTLFDKVYYRIRCIELG